MADPFSYTYPSPLSPYAHIKDLPPLPDTIAEDGKSYVNPPRADGRECSESYERFVEPLDNGRRGGL
jgi:hypothetical protein